jgi:glycosyltransferase involved in cell wall biosynthesis
MIRDVPETAVRLLLGASVEAEDGGYIIGLDGKKYSVSPEVYEESKSVARALAVRDRRIEFASDILELRHDAEDLFLNKFFNQGLPRILFVPSGEMASAFYRARIPADVMMTKGIAVSHYTDRLDASKALRYEILWIQLTISPMILSIVRQAKEAGVKIVYDVDDRFDSVLPDNPAAAVYVKEKQDEIWELIGLADLVTVSTQTLADHIRPRAGGEVRVLPNFVPASITGRREDPDPSIFKILWAGSPTHRRDLAIMAPALRDVLEAHQGKVRFVCFGETLPEALQDVRQYVDQRKFVAFSDYLDELGSIGADLMVAPLEDNEFNGSKSAVKALEAASCGYPILMSPVGEYPEIVSDGFPGTLVPDDQWRAAFELSINFKDKLAERGKAAKDWVLKNRCLIASNAKQWADAASSLVALERSPS